METNRDTVLIVDDREINRAALSSIFEGKYNVLEAENGEQALMLIGQYRDKLAVMLLDIVMPVLDGYGVMEEAGKRGYLRELPVVVITAENSTENELRVFDLGASDIIAKPFEPHVVLRRVQNLIDLNLRKLHQDELIERQAEKLRQSSDVMIDALSAIIEYRSLETGQHINRIGLFTRTLLEDVAKNCPEYLLSERVISLISSASSLHDIGKIAIPDAILNKPGKLTPEEYECMKTHSAKGAEMLTTLSRMDNPEYLRYAYNICRYHHERWDGRGYPDGLKGDAIPLCAQVVGIADCYDALTNDRVYKKALPPEQAVNMILNGECGAFSPRLLESLKNVEGTFASLTAQYIDSAPARPREHSAPAALPAARYADGLDARQSAQDKYFTLLRQLNCTVMEVDFNTGLYHLVYQTGECFAPLGAGATFEESFRGFVSRSVCPEDRVEALSALDGYVDGMFDEGLMRRTRRYRVRSGSGDYVWYRATLLRVDTGVIHQRLALILWQPEGGDAPAFRLDTEEQAAMHLLENAIGSVQRCRLDKWYTMDRAPGRLLALLDYSEEELLALCGNRYIDLIHPDDRADVRRQVEEQSRRGNMMELEYRLVGKNGRVIWVLDKTLRVIGEEGEDYLYYVLIDITQSRQTQQQLRLLTERYRLLLEQTDDIVFDWDARKDILELSRNWEDKFGYRPVRMEASRKLEKASHIHPEDAKQIRRVLELVRSGSRSCPEIEVRVADADGRYRWCRARMVPQFDDGGVMLGVIGVISNIDREKRAAQALMKEAERDALTGLYNRRAMVRRVEETIAVLGKDETAAMLLFDLDGFKQVNDHFGHLFGDEVLQQAAGRFLQTVPGGDIVARVGGDEFLVFLRELPDPEAARLCAEQISGALNDAFGRMMTECRPSCSVGIAMCPGDGTDFNTLFRCSDIALYRAKGAGKDCIELYDAETMGNDFSWRTSEPITEPTQ